MSANPRQFDDLKSILKGVYFLSEESYRCGLEGIGFILRESMSSIRTALERDNYSVYMEDATNREELAELFVLMEHLTRLSDEQKTELLRLLEETTLKSIN